MKRNEYTHTTVEALVRLQYKARGFSFLPRQPITSLLAGRHASRLRGRGLNFEELRDYRAGDDIRSMDWKATRRTGKPHVRVFTEERDRSTYLLVDQRAAMFFGSVLNMKSVTAAELAALAAWRTLDQGDRVGAVIFNDTECVVLKPQRSRDHVHRILGEITRMNQALPEISLDAKSPSVSLNEALSKVEHLTTHDCLICVFTDSEGVNDESRRILTRVAQRNDVLAALVYDPLGTALPEMGKVVFSRGDVQLEVDTSVRHLRQ